MGWMIPLTKLDEQQRAFLSDFAAAPDQNYWLRGMPGTGKTILLIQAIFEYMTARPGSHIHIVGFTHALVNMIRDGVDAAIEEHQGIIGQELAELRRQSQLRVSTYHSFLYHEEETDLLIIDEVQDIPLEKLKALKNSCKTVLMAGDINQSIYDNGCSSEDIRQLFHPKEYELQTIYRVGEKIVRIAKPFCNSGSLHEKMCWRGRKTRVEVTQYSTREEDLEETLKKAVQLRTNGYSTAILLPNKFLLHEVGNTYLKAHHLPLLPENASTESLSQYYYSNEGKKVFNIHMEKHGAALCFVGNQESHRFKHAQDHKVILMTYHSAKGLDFDCVLLPLLSLGNKVGEKEYLEQPLFFVALTRAKEQLFISYYDKPHKLVQAIDKTMVNVKESNLFNFDL